MKTILEEEKELFFFNNINQKIPQDLQNLYKEDIGKIRSGFEMGIRFMIQFNQKHPNNHNNDFKHD